MNPANPQDLDPRLKEVYDRVMNTRVGSQPLYSPQTPPQPQPVAPAPQTAPQASQPTGPVTFRADQAQPTSRRGVPFAAIATLVVLFFIAYLLLWLKIFNVSIPFLPL